MNSNYPFTFLLIIGCFGILKSQQIDTELDSLIRVKIREARKMENYHPNKVDIEKIRKDYYHKKDSTHLTNVQQKMKSAPKEEVLDYFSNWIDHHVDERRRTDTFFDKTLEMFYQYDRQAAFDFCSDRVTIVVQPKDYEPDYGIQREYNLETHPYLRFLYEHYPLAQVLAVLASNTDLSEEQNYWYVFINIGYIKRNICQKDTVCMQKIHDYLKAYFAMNKEAVPNERFIHGLIAPVIFPHKRAEDGYNEALLRRSKGN